MLKKNLYIILIFSFYQILADNREFVYPVAFIKNEESPIIFLLHQKSPYNLDLLYWDSESKNIQKSGLDFLSPGDLKILPGSNGFSFFYNKKLRIKYFNSDKLKEIVFFDPTYDVGTIEWIDDFNCYFSAKRDNKFCVFHTNLKNQETFCVQKIEDDDGKFNECIYPQKVGSNLFYIEQSRDENYRTKKFRFKIIMTSYPDPLVTKKIDYFRSRELILDVGNSSISFLKMISNSEGFFIEHAAQIDKEEKLILMTCKHFFKGEDGKWKESELFDFYLPTSYLFKKNSRLYESILPFLPKYTPNKIVFCSCFSKKDLYCEEFYENDLKVDIYVYDLVKNCIEKKTSAKNSQIFFAPIIIGEKVFYGGSITDFFGNLNPKLFELPYFLF